MTVEKDPVDARQGRATGIGRRILVTSIILAVIVAAALYLIY